MTAFSEQLAAIHAAFADPITYSGPGLDLDPIAAVYSNEAADPFAGKGKTLRIVTFEILYSALPRQPDKADQLIHETGTWSIVDVTERDDLGAWIVTVERAP